MNYRWEGRLFTVKKQDCWSESEIARIGSWPNIVIRGIRRACGRRTVPQLLTTEQRRLWEAGQPFEISRSQKRYIVMNLDTFRVVRFKPEYLKLSEDPYNK